jgi:hypothetical protein
MPEQRKRNTRVRVTVAERYKLLASGELKVEDLDDEEIFRMQLKDKDGFFRGRPPKWLPREVMVAMQAEFRRRAQEQLNELLPLAMKRHRRLLTGKPTMSDTVSMQAIKEAYDRTLGKVTQTSESHVTVEHRTFEDVLEEILVEVENDDERAIES